MMIKKENVIILSTADWDEPNWTNKQHIAMKLSEMGCRVLYTEPPLSLWRFVLNAARNYKRQNWLRKCLILRKVGRGFYILTLFNLLPARFWKINYYIGSFVNILYIRFFQHLLGFGTPYLLNYMPFFDKFIGKFGERSAVYDCVDEYSGMTGIIPGIVELEKRLLKKSDAVSVTARGLLPLKKKYNPNTHFIQNVGNSALFRRERINDLRTPELMKRFAGKKKIGFIGAVNFKLDPILIERLLDDHEDAIFIFIGPIYDFDVSRFENRDNVIFTGAKRLQDIPLYVKDFNAAIIPYFINKYTRYVFPLKLFEFFAAKIPIISTPLPELKYYDNALLVASNADEFSAYIGKILSDGPDLERISKGYALSLEANWENRAKCLFELMSSSASEKETALPAKDPMIVISNADWDEPNWTNKQHITSELGKMGHRILYIEPPIFLGRWLIHILQRYRGQPWISKILPLRKVRRGLYVLALFYPFPGSFFKLNYLIGNAINVMFSKFIAAILGFKAPLLLDYMPDADAFIGAFGEKRSIYDCVDEFSGLDKINPETEQLEIKLMKRTDAVVVTARGHLPLKSGYNGNTKLILNVGNTGIHLRERIESLPMPEDMREFSGRKIIGFTGAVNFKLDTELLLKAGRAHPEKIFLLIGPIDNSFNISKLRKQSNFYFFGPRKLVDLPVYVRYFDIGMIPYTLTKYNKYNFPLKLLEYFAAKVPVVSTRLPEIEYYGDIAYIAGNADEFIDLIDRVTSSRASLSERLERGYDIAKRNNWRTRTEEIRRIFYE